MPGRSLLLALTLLGLMAVPAAAKSDQQRAREALQAGEVMPLQEILGQVQQRVEGRILNVWLERADRGPWIYRLKLLDHFGNIVGVIVDARSGHILQIFAPRH